MKRTLLVCAVVLLSLAAAYAQQQSLQDVYMLNYYSTRNNTAGADQVTRIINPGTQGTPMTPVNEGTICADVYVFDSTQEMIECCSCKVTANGILELSLLNDLTQNPLTGFPAPNAGVIKVVSDVRTNCNEQNPLPIPLLLGWQTHIQEPKTGSYVTTEDGFQRAPLTYGGDFKSTELEFLGTTCAMVQFLGSTKGVCHCGTNS
jgi:hypothetical protein